MAAHRHTLCVRGIILALLLCGHSLAAQEVATSFDEAFKAAKSSPTQLDRADSLEHKIGLFEKMIREYKDHPRLDEVKLSAFHTLTISDNAEYLAKANVLIREVISNTPPDSPLGCDARLFFVRFQANKTRHQPFEDLKYAAIVLSEMEARLDPKSIYRARWIEHKSKLLRREENYVEALTTVVEYCRETYAWPKEMWDIMMEENPGQYQEFRRMFMLLNNEMVEAIASSKDPKISAILRNAPRGVTRHPRVRDTWKEFEERYILGDGQTFEGVVESMIQATMKNMDTLPGETGSSATPPEPATMPSDNTNALATPAQAKDNDRSAIGWQAGVLVAALAGVGALWMIMRRRAKSSSR